MKIINIFLVFIFSIISMSIKAQKINKQNNLDSFNLKSISNDKKKISSNNFIQKSRDSISTNIFSSIIIKDSTDKLKIRKSQFADKARFETTQNGLLMQIMPGQ